MDIERFVLENPPVVWEVERELVDEDLAMMNLPVGAKASPLKAIRMVHHQAARLLASGARPGEVSIATGICLSRISILQNDPAFKELMAFYEDQEHSRNQEILEEAAQVKLRMVGLGIVAAEEMLQRLTDEPELLKTKDLVEVMKASLDRGGYAPVQKKVKEHTLGADLLREIKQEARIIEGERVFEKQTTKNRESELGNGGSEETISRTEEITWIESEGEGIREEIQEGAELTFQSD